MLRSSRIAPRAARRRTVFAWLIALAVFGSTFAVTAAAPRPASPAIAPSSISASQYCPDSQELQMLAKINNLRRQHGLGSLTLTRTLGAAAEHHSRDMAAYNYFGHTLRGGVTWSQNIRNHGYTYNTYLGENIAAGFPGDSRTFDQWMNSSSHRANMLNSRFKAIGIGRAYNAGARYDWYWTATFGGYRDAAVRC